MRWIRCHGCGQRHRSAGKEWTRLPRVPWGCSRYDVVCNFVVDTQDFTAIANSWNCVTGNSCYVAAYDLNNNGRIDVIDLTIDTSRWNCQFGQACYS